MSSLVVLTDAWKNRDKLGDTDRNRELAAFLPSALEIQEAPPNPITRWVSRSLLTLLVMGLVWAYHGEVNIVASAEGKIIPGSRVKQIQPLEKAVVKSILVKEGEAVAAGQALVELDGTLTYADQNRLSGDLNAAQLQLAVSQSFLKLLETALDRKEAIAFTSLRLESVASATEPEVSLYKKLLWQQWLQYRAQLQALQSALEKTTAEQLVAREVTKKIGQILPIISRRTASMKDMYLKKFTSETNYLELEQERIQQTQDLAAERQRIKQLGAAIQEIKQQINAFTAQTSGTQLLAIAKNQRKIDGLREELTKAADLNARQILYSPVSGRVQALSINTVGGIVTEAQQLMLIVPDEEQLEVEVILENKDIGFVEEGMPTEIKIHTFPFTKYGVIDGKVIAVSSDASIDEKRGLTYAMRLRMASNSIMVNGKRVKLIPGMAVTAEVQTGKRRIVEFFLAPLLRHSEESLRER